MLWEWITKGRSSRTRLVLSIVFVGVVVCTWFVRVDSGFKRKYVAYRISALGETIEFTTSTEERVRALRAAWGYASGEYSFAAVYALDMLGKRGEHTTPYVPRIAELLFAAEPGVQREAALALCDLGPLAIAALPALLKKLRTGDSNDDSTWFAAEAIGKIGKDAHTAIPTLREVYESSERPLLPYIQSAIEAIERSQRQ